MEKILRNDNAMRRRLSTIVQDILSICESSKFPPDVKNDIQKAERFAKFEDDLKECFKELLEEECPIVITGETSAGKSTLLNVLIGHDVLPASTLRCTNTVCRLRRGEKREVHMVRKNGKPDTFSFQKDEEMKKKLKSLFKENDAEDTDLKSIDIFIPAPILQGHVTIVDTPGFGDREDTNNDLFEYLPKAVACIYVIKTNNAGGVQADRLLKIWEYQVKWHEKNQRAFNSDLMIFVCNAWDQIEEDEEEDVLFSISNKLNETWKNYKDEQLMTLSARQEIASLRKGEKPSFKFDHLIKKISELVPGCLKVKIERHLRYVSVLSERLSELINIKIGQSVEVLENLYAEVKKMIRAMEKFGNMITNDDELKQNVFTHINEEYKELARKAREHLCRIDIKQKILQECEHADLSDFNVFEMLEKECVSLIYRNVEKEMNIWSKENNIGNRWREIKGRILEEIGGNENEQVTVVKFSAEYEGKDTGKKNDRHGEKDKNRWSVFTTGEKIALAAASPLVIPVTIVSSVPALLLGTVLMIHERTENSRKVQNFHEDRQAIMSTCLERMLEQFYSQDNISDRFERNYIRFYVENWDGIRKDLKVHYSRMEVSVKKASDDVDDASEKHDSLVKLAERISKKIHEINDFEIEFFQDK